MLSDAHIHLADLAAREPDFHLRLGDTDWRCCSVCHDPREWHIQEQLITLLPAGSVQRSFGIHPQAARMTHADFLASLAARGELVAIGEAGFDFFADRPDRVRTKENEAIQRQAFEFQLFLAIKYSLPLIMHVRKAMDLVFEYSARLARLPAVLFHCYSGTEADALSILRRRMEAWFSFGTPLLKGNLRAARACASIPKDRLLAETDAPWQPPRGSEWTGCGHLERVLESMALIRGEPEAGLGSQIDVNFDRAFRMPATGSGRTEGRGHGF